MKEELVVTDEQLLANYTRGDQRAFAELAARYQQELVGFLFRFVSDAQAAEDLFQEAFVQVHRNAKSFDAGRKFRPWLFTIAANKARDFLRSTGRRTLHSLDNVAGGRGQDEDSATFLDLMQSDMMPPVVELQNAEDVARVQRVLAELPTIYREVLVMSYFHQFSYKEMAEMLRIPLGTVKSRLHAALALFAKSYKASESGKAAVRETQ